MAATVDFFLVCNNILKLELLTQISGYLDNVIITEISCIDNWNWDNKTVIATDKDIEDSLLNGKICIILLKSKSFDNIGVYIKKQGNDFEYNIWINTDKLTPMDSNVINWENEFIYDRCYNIFEKVVQKLKLSFKVFAIGTEATFTYKPSIKEMIENSYNIISWIVPNGDLIFENDVFYIKKIDSLNATILEKW